MRPKSYACPTPEVAQYVDSLLGLQNDADLNTALQKAKEFGTPPLQLTPSDARHIEVLARLVKPQKILEIGTLCGYSGIALARALEDGGRLYTCEMSHHHATAAAETFRALGLDKKITLIEGDIFDQLTTLAQNGPYDVIFMDAKKEDYPKLFEWCVENLRVGGLLIADNVFALGHIHKQASELSEQLNDIVVGVKKFNEMCANDKRLSTTILPTGEGLLVATKLINGQKSHEFLKKSFVEIS